MMRRSTSPRSRGMRAGLDLDMIVKTARLVPPVNLTMQAVATELGVDRKALSYYVEDRESLLALVATDAFSANFATVSIPPASSWQEACRFFAQGFAASLIQTGSLVEHFRLGHSLAVGFLQPGESILAKMIAAGFEGQMAARLVHLLSNICIAYAKDCVIAARGGRALAGSVRSAIASSEAHDFENISTILEAGVAIDSDEQLSLSITVFLEGAAMLLLKRAKD
jgi:TetR/AcrR family tetracycline transcriptional repressor